MSELVYYTYIDKRNKEINKNERGKRVRETNKISSKKRVGV